MRLIYRVAALGAAMSLTAPAMAQAPLSRCPAASSDARSYVQGLRKLRETGGGCGMFVPCSSSIVYAPGGARPYGLAPTQVAWEDGLGSSLGKLSFTLAVSKERAMALLQRGTGKTCTTINDYSCSFSSTSGAGGVLSVNLHYLGGPSASVELVCQYWRR